MHEWIIGLPKQIIESLKIVKESGVSYAEQLQRLSEIDIANVVVSGMGGSGIGGEILKELGNKYSKIPILTAKDYFIPYLTGRKTLFFATSYSGNTEETISAYLEAKRRKAQTVVITSGGHLAELAKKNRDILIQIPSGFSPRQAIGYLFTPLLLITSSLKILPFTRKDLKETAGELSSRIRRCKGVAKRLANTFYQRIPYILAGSPLYAPIAYRWKCQLNENAKTLAFYNFLPEQNHNEIEGIGRPPIMKDLLVMAVLVDPESDRQTHRRIQLLPKILKGEFFRLLRVEPQGRGDLERIFYLVLIGDLVSYYLGGLYKQDIQKIERIERLKEMLISTSPEAKPKGL